MEENKEQEHEPTEEEIKKHAEWEKSYEEFKQKVSDYIFEEWDEEKLDIMDVFLAMQEVQNSFIALAFNIIYDSGKEEGKEESFNEKVKKEISEIYGEVNKE